MKIGILGGGQLGRMIALAAYPLGAEIRVFDPSEHSPAGHVAELTVGQYTDKNRLERFADGLDCVTYEFENVPAETVHFLSERLPVYPPPAALETGQDRLTEKTFFRTLGIPVPGFRAVATREEFDAALSDIGYPAVLKTRRFGYDGKGQFTLRSEEEAHRAWNELRAYPLILEEFVPFEREVSILAVRSLTGETAFYPLVENEHQDGILRISRTREPDPALQKAAEGYAKAIFTATGYVGVLAVEFFQQGGRLLANEMAPRVHNSGHWTIEGASTSQFENHVRALLGYPLGSTAVYGAAAMVNIIGEIPAIAPLLGLADVHLHLYGKSPRPRRKVGHITVLADTPGHCLTRLNALLRILGYSNKSARA